MMQPARRSGLEAHCLAGALLAIALMPQAASADEKGRALTEAYNASGQALFRRFAAVPGNIVFSPYSIGTAMAMALSGARGETETEMIAVLKHRLGRADIDAANADLLAALNAYDRSGRPPTCDRGLRLVGERCEAAPSANGLCPLGARRDGAQCVSVPIPPRSARLLAANALMQVGNPDLISPDYAATLKTGYAAELFKNAGLADINGWVSRKTEGKIDKILDRLDPNTVAVLLNAIYFKARWDSAFDKKLTRNETFNLSRSQKVAVATMHQNHDFAVVARPGYRAIRLPYEVEQLGLVIVLPDDVDGVGAVGARLNDEELSQVLAALRTNSALVDLALPRFKAAFEARLGPHFQQMGMTRAFGLGQTDFSGMTGRPASEVAFAISDVIHRAVIEVAEESTEAAAATAVVVVGRAIRPKPEPIRFHVDRPFLFYLADEATGAILFQGRITDPR